MNATPNRAGIFLVVFFFVASAALIPASFNIAPGSAALANPFTTKPEDQKKEPAPPSLSIPPVTGQKFVQWQQQLRTGMSRLIRESRETGQYHTLFFMFALAFAYGVVHSAGPGHGKAVALSYVLGTRPGLVQGLMFANILALTHAVSGILLVIVVKLILETGLTGSLDQVTRATQRISFSLIIVLGLYILTRALGRLFRPGPADAAPAPVTSAGQMVSAVTIGLIPCPGVVMVVLFCLTMDALWLGILMGLSIGIGMAMTISVVVAVAISGKRAVLSGADRFKGAAARLELFIEFSAGLAVAALGCLLLLTAA